MKKPLYLIPIFAFALLLPPALVPQAAFADNPKVATDVTPKYQSDTEPESGVWRKITISKYTSSHHRSVFYTPLATMSAPRGTYRRLYTEPSLSKGAFSYLWHDGRTWQINWFYKSKSGHSHVALNETYVKMENVTVPKKKANPWAGIPQNIKDAVTQAAPNADEATQIKAAGVLIAAQSKTGSVIGSELIAEVKKRGPAGVAWAAGLHDQNGGDVHLAGAALIKSFANGKNDLAGKIAKAVSADEDLSKLLAKVNAGTVPPIEGVEVGAAKNKVAEKIEKPLADKIKGKKFSSADSAPIASAFTKFIWEPWKSDKKSFVAADVREVSAAKGALASLVDAWTTDAVQNESRRNGVIVLYMGLGDEKVPEWAKDDPVIKTILTGEGRDKIAAFKNFPALMRNCMDHWAAEEGKENEPKLPAGCFTVGAAELKAAVQLGGTKQAEWTSAFLTEAVGHANLLLAALNKDPNALAKEIAGASNTEEDAPTDGTERERRERDNRISSEKFFGMDELFGAFGDTVSNPDGTKKPLNNVFRVDGREFALVVRTVAKTVPDGSGGMKRVMTNQVGIYDISNKHDIVGQRFDLGDTGEHKITLPGRKRAYVLNIPGDMSKPIGFAPVNLAEGETGKIMIPDVPKGQPYPSAGSGKKWVAGTEVEAAGMPSAVDLYRSRAQKALASTSKVTLDGKTYNVTGESAGSGNLLYWDTETAALAAKSDSPWAITPAMMASVSKKGNNGQMELIKDSNMGMAVLGKAPGGGWYGLKWVPTRAGEGFYVTVKTNKPPAADAPPKTETSTGNGNTTTGNGNDNQTTPRTPQGGIDVASLNQHIPANLRLGDSGKSRRGQFHLVNDTSAGILFEVAMANGGDTAKPTDRNLWATYSYASGYQESGVKVTEATFLQGEGRKYLITKDSKGGLAFLFLHKAPEFVPAKGGGENAVIQFDGRVRSGTLADGGIQDRKLLAHVLGRSDALKQSASLKNAIQSLTGADYAKFSSMIGGSLTRITVNINKEGTDGIACFIDFEQGAWKVSKKEGCDPSFTPGDNREGDAQSVAIDKRTDAIVDGLPMNKLKDTANGVWSEGDKKYARIIQGLDPFVAGGAYVAPNAIAGVDAASPAEVRVVFPVLEAATGKHITDDYKKARFRMQSMDGFAVLGKALSAPLKKAITEKKGAIAISDFPKGFAVGGIQLPSDYLTASINDPTKFELKVIGPRNASGGGLVMIHKGEKNAQKCIGAIAAWGSVTLANACGKSGV